jgi:ADP-ribose pyrophosphatase
MVNNSKILSTKTVYKTNFFKVDQVEIERKGKVFKKEIISRRPHVLILPLTNENEIYLIKQFRDVYQKELLEVVAGYIEEDEDPLAGAKRELKEETGLSANNWNHLTTIQTSANMNSTIYIYVAKDLTEGVSEQEEDEEISLIKIPFDEAVKKVVEGEIFVSAYMTAILLLDKLKKEGKI